MIFSVPDVLVMSPPLTARSAEAVMFPVKIDVDDTENVPVTAVLRKSAIAESPMVAEFVLSATLRKMTLPEPARMPPVPTIRSLAPPIVRFALTVLAALLVKPPPNVCRNAPKVFA